MTSLFAGTYQEDVVLAKDMKFKLLSGEQMPLVGCTYFFLDFDLVKTFFFTKCKKV